MANIYDDISDSTHPKIRLLVLDPSDDSLADLHCSLVTCPLSAPGEYAALSYVWGTTPERITIICNDQTLQITPNLWLALLHLRHPAAPTILWVDALCINQADLHERSSQVTLMRDIYLSAKVTYIWLGVEDVYSNTVVELCRRKEQEKDTGEASPPLTNRGHIEPLGLLIEFLKRPWFTRSWVIQELCLSQDPILVVGTILIPWHLFGSVLSQVNNELTHKLAEQSRSPSRQVDSRTVVAALQVMRSDGFVAARTLNLERQEHHRDEKDEPAGLLELLAEFRNFETTDPRDKVFALLGLAADPSIMKPDYTISVNECYINAAVGIIQSTKTLRVLESLPVFERYRDETLPSWVPQWDSENRSGEPGMRLTSHVRSVGHTGDNIKTWEAQLPGTTTHSSVINLEYIAPDVLALDGIVTDTISELGPRLQFPSTMYNSFAEGYWTSWLSTVGLAASGMMEMGRIGATMADWQSLAMAMDPYPPTGEGSRQAFLATLYGPEADMEQASLTFDLAMEQHRPRTGWRGTVSDALGGVSSGMMNAFDGAYHMWRSYGAAEQPTFGAALSNCWDKRLARTRGGYLALLPWRAEEGDEIALLPGGPKPFVLRRVERGRYKVVGACYVHGMMKGEAWDDDRMGRIELV